MSVLAADHHPAPPGKASSLLHWPLRASVMALVLVAWALAVLRDIPKALPTIVQRLGDTDDALRLVEVREWLAGASWFDVHIARLGLADGLAIHWSRLLDVPIAGLILLFGTFLPADKAEVAARLVWPLLVLAPLLYILARSAERRGGRLATIFVLFLAITCFSGLMQFNPGRIDHHNVQILGAVGGLLLLARSYREPAIGTIGGMVMGLGLTVGLEALPLVVLGCAAAALLSTIDPASTPGISRFGKALAATTALLFVLTTSPARYGVPTCDFLSINLLAAILCGGVGLAALAHPACGGNALRRISTLGVAGAAGATAYASIAPACLAGPFASMDPRVFDMWLNHVQEAKSAFWLAETHPPEGIVCILWLSAGLFCQTMLWRQNARETQARLELALMVCAAALGMWQIKLLPYASFLAAVPIAIWTANLSGTPKVSAMTVRMGALLLVSQTTLLVSLNAASALMPVKLGQADAMESLSACTELRSFEPLRQLKPGFMVGHMDMGPFLIAYTQHRMLAAPYHRIWPAILENQLIMSSSPDTAKARVMVLNADYVADCAGMGDPFMTGPKAENGLRARLLRGETPDFLEAIQFNQPTPIKVWRVVK